MCGRIMLDCAYRCCAVGLFAAPTSCGYRCLEPRSVNTAPFRVHPSCGKVSVIPASPHQPVKTFSEILCRSARAASTCFLKAGSRSISSSTFRMEWITVE